MIDRQRRQAVRNRQLDVFASELEGAVQASAEAAGVACACVVRLAGTLKPEYAEALQQVEVAGKSIAEYAAANGISTNNAGVRVFRAREALRKQVARSCGTCAEHGCLDCTCAAKKNRARSVMSAPGLRLFRESAHHRASPGASP